MRKLWRPPCCPRRNYRQVKRRKNLPALGDLVISLLCDADITTVTNRCDSFDLAMLFAPVLGGILSEPAIQYPNSVLARIQLLRDYPFFLPCAATAALGALAAAMVFFWLEEVCLFYCTVSFLIYVLTFDAR
jgi:hypothetical protein